MQMGENKKLGEEQLGQVAGGGSADAHCWFQVSEELSLNKEPVSQRDDGSPFQRKCYHFGNPVCAFGNCRCYGTEHCKDGYHRCDENGQYIRGHA
jgi:hypothetical protein